MVVVLGSLLYGLSAGDSTQPGLLDRIRLVAVVSALALDLMVLGSMVTRIADLGWTPNRIAALARNPTPMRASFERDSPSRGSGFNGPFGSPAQATNPR